MRTIPQSILDELAKREAIEPEYHLDIWPEAGPYARLDTYSQWKGTDDPMQGSDSNVSFDRKPGSLVLGPGSSVTAAHTGASSLAFEKVLRVRVTDNYSDHWFYGYRHYGWIRTVLQNDSYEEIPFIAGATQILNSIIIRSQHYGNIDPGCWVAIVDDNGNQLGNAVDFAPGATDSDVTVTGLAASLRRGIRYSLRIGIKQINTGALTGYGGTSVVWTAGYRFSVYAAGTSPAWQIAYGSTGYFPIGGNSGYATSGVATRQIDVGEVPTVDGVVSFSDVVPLDTKLVVTAWYTDNPAYIGDATTVNWTSYGVVESGQTIPAHHWWRFEFALTGNAAGDNTPAVDSLDVRYRPLPLTFSSNSEIISEAVTGYFYPWVYPLSPVTVERVVSRSFDALDKITAFTAKLSPKLPKTITGGMVCTLVQTDETDEVLASALRGAAARVRVGFAGVADTLTMYEGIVEDMTYSDQRYLVTLQDNLRITDVRVPTDKAGADWSGASTYTLGTIVVYGNYSWECILDVTVPGTPPDQDPTHWQVAGTVWNDLVYNQSTAPDAVAWHLCEAAEDIVRNQINLRSENIDFQSIYDVKAARTGYTCERLVTKPTSAEEMLTEIAWLLDAAWIPRGRQIALVPEPIASDEPVDFITGEDIKLDLRYRRGWKELVNQCLILTGYSGDGQGEEQFGQGYAVSDATSIADYHNTALMQVFKDKWQVPSSILSARATSHVNKFKDGRRLISFTGTLRLIGLEPGDLVAFQSDQMPPNERGVIKAMVIDTRLDFTEQHIALTLMEVV